MNKKGKSAATVTRSIASLKSFYTYLLQKGFINKNPAKNIARVKVERALPQILTSKEVELFLEQPQCTDAKGYRDHAMLELLYATGIRVSELIALEFYRCKSQHRNLALCRKIKRAYNSAVSRCNQSIKRLYQRYSP